jgi:transcriptional regulator with XRE-family HTH domain
MGEYTRQASTAERLREAMAVSGKKQADLKRETGIDSAAISRYLSGAYEPKQVAIGKLAAALDVSEMWLCGYDVPRDRTPEQKKNDHLVKVIVQLRKDPEFFDVVSALADLPAEQYAVVKQLISALGHK